MRSIQLWRRLDRLEQLRPKPNDQDTPEARRTWCLANGYDPDTVVIAGWGNPRGMLILPLKDDTL